MTFYHIQTIRSSLVPSSSKNQLRSAEKFDVFNAVQHVVVRKQQWFGVFRIILAPKDTDCALVLELKQKNLQTHWLLFTATETLFLPLFL